MVGLQIFRQRILFGAVTSKGGGTGEGCGGVEQIHPVDRGIGWERVAVAAACQEVERHHSEAAVCIAYQRAAAYHHIEVVAQAVLDRHVDDAATCWLGEIEAEGHATHLRESSLAGTEGDAVLQQLLELAGRHRQQGQRVVEAQRVFNVESGNTTRRLIGGIIGEGGHLGTAHHINATDLRANATAILQRQHHRGVDLAGVVEVGVSR